MKPLHQFTTAEADRWIIKMRRSLAEHAERLNEARHANEVRAAMDTDLMLLREMVDMQPAKRQKIEALSARYQRK